jgi:hypothetical protein
MLLFLKYILFNRLLFLVLDFQWYQHYDIQSHHFSFHPRMRVIKLKHIYPFFNKFNRSLVQLLLSLARKQQNSTNTSNIFSSKRTKIIKSNWYITFITICFKIKKWKSVIYLYVIVLWFTCFYLYLLTIPKTLITKHLYSISTYSSNSIRL